MTGDWNEHEIRTLKNLKSRGYTSKVISQALDRSINSIEHQWSKIKPRKVPYAGKDSRMEEWNIYS